MTKQTSNPIEEIRSALESNKAVIGTERSIKNLKLGKVLKVFLTSNCPDDIKGDIEHYAKVSGTELIVLEQPNDELGNICKKTFAISVVSILK